MSFHQHRRVTFHAAIIVSCEQDDQHSYVAEAGPVVLNRVIEGQIDEIVHDESYGDCKNEQSALLILILNG